MIREPEIGILRSVQVWITSELRACTLFQQEDIHFVAEDEGDFETELDKRINRGILCGFISTTALRKVSHTERDASVQIKVFESVKIHRGYVGLVVPWTALRLAEAILAQLDHARMAEAPFAYFEASEGEAITLESQSPWLVYSVNLVGKMRIKVTTV